MRNYTTAAAGLSLLLLAGCASDGERLAPIEAREVRRPATTVSGNSTRAAPSNSPLGAKPLRPDAPKVMALPDAGLAGAPTALPLPSPMPLPVPGGVVAQPPVGSTPPASTPASAGAALLPPAPETAAPAATEAVAPSTGAAAGGLALVEPARNQPPAVRQLLQEAEAARQAADFVRARAVLERGVKLAPREPELWYRLAEVAFAERDWEQCQSLAQRAASLAREAPGLRARATALEQAAAAKIPTRVGR